jgi:hypothetical protein
MVSYFVVLDVIFHSELIILVSVQLESDWVHIFLILYYNILY